MGAFLAHMQFSQPDESSGEVPSGRWPTPGPRRAPSAAARAGASLAEIFADSPRNQSVTSTSPTRPIPATASCWFPLRRRNRRR